MNGLITFLPDQQHTLFLCLASLFVPLALAITFRFLRLNWHIDSERSDGLVTFSKRAIGVMLASGTGTFLLLNVHNVSGLFGILSWFAFRFDWTHSAAIVASAAALVAALKVHNDPEVLALIVGAAGIVSALFVFDVPYQAGVVWCLAVLPIWILYRFLRWQLVAPDPTAPPSDWITRTYERGAKISNINHVRRDFSRQSYLSSEPSILIGDQWVTTETLAGNIMLPGAPGTGKTIVLRLMMQSVLKRITPGSGHRAIIFDAKHEQISVLAGMQLESPVIIMNPFDQRTSVWDLARDFRTPSDALQLAMLFLPDTQKDNDPFWSKSARGLLSDVILAHIIAMQEGRLPHWSLSDLIRSLQTKEEIEKALALSDRTKNALRNIHEDKIYHGVLATLDLVRREFEPLAALWDAPSEDPSRLFSLTDWIKESGIIVLGPSLTAETVINPLNRLILDRVAQLLLDQEDNDQSRSAAKSRTWLFLDEFPRLGRMPRIENLMTNGRSKGVIVVLAFQDISELKDQRLYGEHFANVIVGTCTHKIFFQASSHTHAAWCADTVGAEEVEVLQKSVANTYGANPSTTITHSASDKTRPLFTKDEFLYLGKPGEATPIRDIPKWLQIFPAALVPRWLIRFYQTSRFSPIRSIAAIQGRVFRMQIPFHQALEALTSKRGADLILRPEAEQFLRTWSDAAPPQQLQTSDVDKRPQNEENPEQVKDLKEAIFNIFTSPNNAKKME